MRLAESVAARLYAAGFTADDPAVIAVRSWNESAREKQAVSVELRRGQFGKTRRARLDELIQEEECGSGSSSRGEEGGGI